MPHRAGSMVRPKEGGGSFGLGEVPMQMTESGERRDGTVKLRNLLSHGQFSCGRDGERTFACTGGQI